MSRHTIDLIAPEQASTLDGLLRERVRRTPNSLAYRSFNTAQSEWLDFTWTEFSAQVDRWRAVLASNKLDKGERVAIMMPNCVEWITFELAAIGLGLVVVPVYNNDRAENVAYILRDTSTRMLFIAGSEQWDKLQSVVDDIPDLDTILSIEDIAARPQGKSPLCLRTWLDSTPDTQVDCVLDRQPDDLAVIFYTSGTTGRPKGVMLSHHNMIWNAWSGMYSIMVYREDIMLSILPLSHTLEHTVGYLVPMATGASVAFARSISLLPEDFLHIRPTIIISVPRIFQKAYVGIADKLRDKPEAIKKLLYKTADIGWERYQYQQGRKPWRPAFVISPLLDALFGKKVRDRFGGRLRFAIVGGAALPYDVASFFLGIGINLQQGYGLTETSPVLTVNTLDDNIPDSIGTALRDVEFRIGGNDELLARSPGVMLGYWKNETASKECIDNDGWLHTGDKARIEDNGHVFITGRLKDIIVLSNGEKVPPDDMEAAIAHDPLFEQVVIYGENRPYLGMITVLNKKEWAPLADSLRLDTNDTSQLTSQQVTDMLRARVSRQLSSFPGYAQVKHIIPILDPWTIENGLMTPTLKVKRNKILEMFKERIESLYQNP